MENRDFEIDPNYVTHLNELNEKDKFFGLALEILTEFCNDIRGRRWANLVKLEENLNSGEQKLLDVPAKAKKQKGIKRAKIVNSEPLMKRFKDEFDKYLTDNSWDKLVEARQNEILNTCKSPDCPEFETLGSINATCWGQMKVKLIAYLTVNKHPNVE